MGIAYPLHGATAAVIVAAPAAVYGALREQNLRKAGPPQSWWKRAPLWPHIGCGAVVVYGLVAFAALVSQIQGAPPTVPDELRWYRAVEVRAFSAVWMTCALPAAVYVLAIHPYLVRLIEHPARRRHTSRPSVLEWVLRADLSAGLKARWQALPGSMWTYKSAIMLVGANVVPLIGALFFGWDVFDVVFLYWAENVIIGLFHIPKMLVAGVSAAASVRKLKSSRVGTVATLVIFTALTSCFFGGFTWGHGSLIINILGSRSGITGDDPFALLFSRIAAAPLGGFTIALASIFWSHAFSLVRNFLVKREYRNASLPFLFFLPFGRVWLTTGVVLVGGILSLGAGPTALTGAVVVAKTAVDLAVHLRERRRAAHLQGDGREPRV
jgi:hypothetical protein